MIPYFSSGKRLVYAQDTELYQESGDVKTSVFNIQPIEDSIWYCYLKGHSCAFRKDLINLYNFQGNMSWDYYLELYCCITGDYIALPDSTMFWRKHSESASYISNDLSKRLMKWDIVNYAFRNIKIICPCLSNHLPDRISYLNYIQKNARITINMRMRLAFCRCILNHILKRSFLSLTIASILNMIITNKKSNTFTQWLSAKAYGFRYPSYFLYNERHRDALS